ncbi:RING/U-box superfamily protein, putative isoform 1 [Melia azedarach]|uniref:RING/U-box superfamily protein, putative isoform 1 n=1 Tax=Melia azedarach TaxID=155640 RepID=A0ACC1YMR4_MELAZ|nr:RING/U-box superfamily protein, putative isoform 1 [Melia azedarach]
MLKELVSGIIKMSPIRCKEAISLWFFTILGGFGTFVLVRVMKRAIYAAFTCVFAFGGAVVGTIAGAMKGQTTETGFLRGAGIGAVAGAITALQLLESAADGESLSKIALITSLLNGKVFMEWVSPAVLKAYQWQISTLETTYRDISDVYDVNGIKGLSIDCIRKLPECRTHSEEMIQLCNEPGCSICLQDFQEGDSARRLPNCGHCFHLECIDKWLTRNGSCPVCREYVCKEIDTL